MDILPLAIPGPVVVIPARIRDARGVLSEIFSEREFARRVAPVRFVQENTSVSEQAGTVRGLHFQLPPNAQGKLLRITRGSVLDVALDLRHDAPSFGRHVAVDLTAESGHMLWIPAGFAHGFCTREPRSEVAYKLTAYYDPASERGVAWDDPDLGIAWPIAPDAAVLSERDRRNPRLKDLPPVFSVAQSAG
jgi:dTDP-4-dehydrorhamnose 3,5-epimerase